MRNHQLLRNVSSYQQMGSCSRKQMIAQWLTLYISEEIDILKSLGVILEIIYLDYVTCFCLT
jgi:hypothetical protein